MRKIVDFFISAYLLPLRISNRLALYVKGKMLPFDEHYLVALDVIRRYFPQDDGIVIDIGAYDADSAIFLGKQLPNNIIVGFEPNPIPYNVGKKKAKKFKNVQLHNFGFADASGELELHVTNNLVSSSIFPVNRNDEFNEERLIKVRMEALDTFFEKYKHILLIKLDVQGAELNVLKSGTETLKKTRLVLTEVNVTKMYEGGCLYFELDTLMRENGFTLHTVITNYNYAGSRYFDILYINSTYAKS